MALNLLAPWNGCELCQTRNKPHINLVQKAPFQNAIATYLASLAMC